MKKQLSRKTIDRENPEWTDADLAQAVPFSALPQRMRQVISARKRGPQRTPTKQLVSLRLSREVLSYFKAKGKGWQTRIDETLKSAINRVS